jgi:anti-sigma factor RsiW
MCDFSGNLVTWIDGELAPKESAAVEQHVQACAECRERVAAYKDASRGFAAYYAATTQGGPAAKPRRIVPRWVPIVAAAAAAVALVIGSLPRAAKPSRELPQQAVVKAPAAEERAAKPAEMAQQVQAQPVAKRRVTPHQRTQRTEWAVAQPAIQIAIPADSMFPPGAVPEGVTYIASVSLAADGSVQGVRLQP